MKRFMPTILSCSIFLVVAGCAARTPTLEGSLRADDPSKKMRMAVTVNDPFADAVGAELSGRGFPVIGSARMRAVLSERSLQLSGMESMDEEKLLEAGKILNADALLFVDTEQRPDGTIEAANIKILGVRSGAVMGSFHYRNGRSGENKKDAAKRIADAINGSFK